LVKEIVLNKLTCFQAYDIRGKLGQELNDKIAYRIGRAMGMFLTQNQQDKKTVVVGGDIRLTSESLKCALSDGLLDAGVDVLDIGLSGTEEIYFATFHLNVSGGVEITASHNPIDYNGMKLVREGAKPISGDSGLKEIQSLAENNDFPEVVVSRGVYKKMDILDDYIEHLFTYVTASQIKPLKLVINSGNGAAGHVIDALEKQFFIKNIPLKIVKLNNEPDGTFPNHHPNPLLKERRADTASAVKEHNADMGIAFDGDFDRCLLFDENGDFIEGYYIVGLLAKAFLKSNPNSKIIHDPRLSWNTIDLVKKDGGTPIQSKTGHAFIKERMRLEDAIYGGEMSAHHYFRDFAYCDSGMIPWLLVSELLSTSKLTLSEMVKNRIEAYPSSGEINCRLENPEKSIELVKSTFQKDALFYDETDGVSLEFNDWRFNLRSSNTEAVVRLNVESRGDTPLMKKKTNEILTLLGMKNSELLI